MLQLIRDRFQGIFVWTFVTVIVVAFAMVGISSYLGNDGQSYVAKVNDTPIPLSDYQSAFQRERALRLQIFGDDISPALLKEEVLQRAALDRLISAELVAQAADDSGFRIANVQLGSQIRQMKEFQNNGQFDQQVYTRVLVSQGLTEEHFEASLRHDMLARQFFNGLTDSVLLTGHDTDRLLSLRKQQRRFGYMVLETAVLVDSIKVDDAAIQKYYDEHGADFNTEAQVSVDYIELSPDSLDVQDMPDEQNLKKMYAEQQAEFSNGEERRASHILIKPEDESDAGQKAAKAKALDLLRQLRAGADFAELAKSSSADPGSARQGGDLGYFSRGMMVGAFEDKAFSMNKGEISEPVKSPYGYHIIKLTDIRAGETQSFEEVRDKLVKRYRQEMAEEQYYEVLDQLTNLTYENPTTLSLAAEELGLKLKTSAMFTRHRGDGIAGDERIREVAFSDDVLEAGNNSEVLTLGENHVLVLRIHDRHPASQRPLAEVSDDIAALLRQQQASDQLRQRGEGIVTRLQDGEDASALARAQGSEWNTSGFVDRFEDSIDKDVLQQIFRMTRPTADAPTTAGSTLPNGDYIIATLYAVRNGKPDEVDAKQRESIAQSRQSGLGQEIGAKIMDSLKQRADVVEYPDKL